MNMLCLSCRPFKTCLRDLPAFPGPPHLPPPESLLICQKCDAPAQAASVGEESQGWLILARAGAAPQPGVGRGPGKNHGVCARPAWCCLRSSTAPSWACSALRLPCEDGTVVESRILGFNSVATTYQLCGVGWVSTSLRLLFLSRKKDMVVVRTK